MEGAETGEDKRVKVADNMYREKGRREDQDEMKGLIRRL